MNQAIPALLVSWQSYYVIIGSSAGALTGLQFVVMALIAQTSMPSTAGEEGVAAFGSPVIVHFCAALLLSAVLTAPWQDGSNVGIVFDACGAAGMLYLIVVVRRARRQDAYEMTHEDWIWHVVLPFLAYAALFAAGLALPSHASSALFLAAVTPAALLYIGIHIAWDTVTYTVLKGLKSRHEPHQGS